MQAESTFVLNPRKSCMRAQHARNAVTIELSRALGRLIVHWRERLRAAFNRIAA
jgi:hypothetical protein